MIVYSTRATLLFAERQESACGVDQPSGLKTSRCEPHTVQAALLPAACLCSALPACRASCASAALISKQAEMRF